MENQRGEAGWVMLDTAGLTSRMTKKKQIQAIYNRRPSVLKVTRPGRKWVGVTKKSGRKRYRRCEGSPGM
jgi:hypothetical protein